MLGREMELTAGAALVVTLVTWSPVAETKAQTFAWTPPAGIESPGISNPPTVARGGLHAVDIIYTGTDRHMYHQWSELGGPLNKPQNIGFVGTATQASVVANGRHKLDVFYRGADGHLWTRWIEDDGEWSAGVSLGGDQIQSAPFAISNGLHRMDIFYAGRDGSLYLTWWDGGPSFSGGERLSEEPLMPGLAQGVPPNLRFRRAPTAVVNGPHLVDVLYVTAVPKRNYGKLRTVWSNGKGSSLIGDWSVAMDLNRPDGAPPSGVQFVGSTVGAASGLMIDGIWRAHVFFTDAVAGGSHVGGLMDLVAAKGQPWTLQSTNIAGGPMVSAAAVNQVFFVNPGLGDPDRPPGLVWSCYLRSPYSEADKAANCLKFPGL